MEKPTRTALVDEVRYAGSRHGEALEFNPREGSVRELQGSAGQRRKPGIIN
jgi:hypothetical protein